jgi:hypothetical protein
MSANEGTRGGGINGVLKGLQYLVTIAVVLAIGYTFLPQILATPVPTTWTLPTADTGGLKATPTQRAITDTRQDNAGAIIVPTMTLDQINATSQAIYQATVAAVESSQVAPFGSKEAPERVPAGVDNVSPAEPTADDTHGSKRTAPVNIQETHQCLHGQVWTDTGCHRPTPTR